MGKQKTKRETIYNYRKKIFITAYVVRKLIEGHKVATYLRGRTVACETALALQKAPAIFSITTKSILKSYDMNKKTSSSISVWKLVNIIIHSYIFITTVNIVSNQTVKFTVNSDREKDKGIHSIAISDYVSVLRVFGCDQPHTAHFSRDCDKGTWGVTME